MSSQKKSDGICFSFRDAGKCKHGPKCKSKRERGGQSSAKKVNITSTNKKRAKKGAIKALTMKVKKKARKEGKREGAGR
jgi:hypothetical protein